MATVKVNWSGGKDSTCAVMKHIMRRDKTKVLCYIPFFDEDTPLITKEHFNFITNTAIEFKEQGAEVHITTGETYYNRVIHEITKGKNKGKPQGFPYFNRGQCHFKRDSKIKALTTYPIGEYDYEDIAIAADETERQKQLNEKKRSILVELGITEKQAKLFCIQTNKLSPHYKYNKRDGCALCPNAKKEEREQWLKDYPEARQKLIFLQEIIKKEKPENYPLRGHKWFIEQKEEE